MITPQNFSSYFPNKITVSEIPSSTKTTDTINEGKNQNRQTHNKSITQDYFNGAAVIDKTGKETPITEKMIQDALDKLDNFNPYNALQIQK